MNIAGVVVHARPEDAALIQAEISTMPGAEIHGVKENGRIVVTVEDEDYKKTSDAVLNLHQIKGVLSATLVYQHCEEDS